MLRFLRSRPRHATDAQLLHAFQQQGDTDALASLFDRYLELVYGICLRYLGAEARAEDAVMAIFEELLQKVPNHQIQHFRNWLHTFVRNHCLMQLRREKRDPSFHSDPLVMQSTAEWHPIDETVPNPPHQEALQGCLDQLNAQQKDCVTLFYFTGKSYQEIAEQRQEPLGQVRSHLQNGRRNLRNCLEQQAKLDEPD